MVNGDAMEIDIDSDEEGVAARLQELEEETVGVAPGRSSASQSQQSTKSVSDSFFEPVHENGRTYANETYFLPNDDAEETRNSIIHQMYTATLSGRLSLHRIKEDVSRILDVGANPCDWAIEIAERYSNCQVVATDLFPYQPTELPANIEFQIDDARNDWTFTEPFDYIHIRSMAGAWSDWGFVYQQAYKHLAADGVIEVVDRGPVHHNTDIPNSYLDIYNGACESAANNAGVSLSRDHLQKERIEEAGLRVFRSVTIEIPIGQWPEDQKQKSLGKLALVGSLERLEAQSTRLLTKYLGWSLTEVKDLCAKVMEEMLHPQAKTSMPCTFVVARKLPLPP